MTQDEVLKLLAQGVVVESAMSSAKLIELAKKFSPYKTNHELIRLGPNSDGGYLIPDDLIGISTCFSPGVSVYSDFELDLLNRYGIGSHQADYSVDGPPEGFKPLSFSKKFIGAHNDEIFITMENWVKNSWQFDIPKDWILQMDIEGAEYSALLATPDHILKRFRIIVLEIHNIEDWTKSCFYNIANALIDKLSQHFIVVHSHPNNWGGQFIVNNLVMPRTIEITLHRKDRCKVTGKFENFPHPLDSPCGEHIQDLALPIIFR